MDFLTPIVDFVVQFGQSHPYVFPVIVILFAIEQILPRLEFIKANSSLQFIVDICKGIDGAVRAILDALKKKEDEKPPVP